MSAAAAATSSSADVASDQPAVRLRQVRKRYGGTLALKGIDLDISAGSIHALIGENGAGKSTCLGAIAGRVQIDEGVISIFGHEVGDTSPRRTRALGVVSVYQELTTIPGLSAQANVFLGQPRSRWGWLRDAAMRARYVELCRDLKVACFADTPAGALSVGDQQLLEIMRALVADARIILLDEPTASLAPHERGVLLDLMRGLRDRGVTVVFVSHNLDEVLEVSDTVTVFRDGAVVRQDRASEVSKKVVVEAMLGRKLSEATTHHHPRAGSGPTRLRVEGLSVPRALTDISFELRAGEILGLGGLVGSGRTSVLRALAGATPSASGELWINSARVRWPRSPRRARALGIALLPEDRKTQGVNLARSGAENIVMSDLGAVARAGFLTTRDIMAAAERAATGFGINAAVLSKPAGTLSGGNQQKLLLARWAHSLPTVLLADEPTRGIDVGAKQEILAHLEHLAGEGMSIIIASSELEEVVQISHRILVLAEGRAVGLLDNSERTVDEHDVLRTIFESDREGHGDEHVATG